MFRMYQIKEIIRKFGSTSVKYILYNNFLNWMTPKDIIGDDQVKFDKNRFTSRKLLLENLNYKFNYFRK